jgi:hypothetical protein
VERSGIDIAPSYDEYVRLAFAIANSCGESGRSCFERLTRLSVKYDAGRNEKLFNDGLNKGRRDNSLGTVYQLARDAGVSLKGDGWKADWEVYRYEGRAAQAPQEGRPEQVPQEGNAENLPNSGAVGGVVHPGAYIYENNSNNRVNKNEKISSQQQKSESDEILDSEDSTGLQAPTNYPVYTWPRFLQQCIDCGERESQRDVLWLSCLSILGTTLAPMLRFNYAHKFFYPNLQLFVVAPAASGKSVMTWAYQLGVPLQMRYRREYKRLMEDYKQKYAEWSVQGKQRAKLPEPEKPPMRLFYISGNNTGTGILENIADSKGIGCIFSSEADEIIEAIGGDYGHWSDVLRKVFDHDPLSYNRRANKEYREIPQTWVTVMMSGTPGQVAPLIPSPENGLFSRQVFYYMQPIRGWNTQFSRNRQTKDYGAQFLQWGFRWDKVMEMIRPAVSEVVFYLNEEQQDAFDNQLALIFRHANAIHGGSGRSTVARIAINLLRLMSMVAWIRALDEWLMADVDGNDEEMPVTKRLLKCPGIEPDPEVSAENVQDGVVSRFQLSINEEDFRATLKLAAILYQHSNYIMAILPPEESCLRPLTPKEIFRHELPFSFSRKEAVEQAEKHGLSARQVDRMIERLLKDEELVRTSHGHFQFNDRFEI